MVVEEYRMLGHAVAFDRMVVMVRGSRIGALRFRAPREQFIALGGFAPDFRQHAVIARAFARRHFDVVALEVLHPPAHVQRKIEHPLLVIAFRSQLAYHDLS